MINVLIADDHAVVRRGLAHILAEASDITVAGEAEDGAEALRLARCGGWDALVLDINLPDRSGFSVLTALRAERATLPVLMLSIYGEDQFALRCLKAGAAGYLTKETAPEELVRAIRRVAAGGKYISAGLAESLAVRAADGGDQPRHTTLSDREFQVMRMLAAGKTPTEIAHALALSVKTVSTYRGRILDKMGLTKSVEIVHYAVQHRLIVCPGAEMMPTTL